MALGLSFPWKLGLSFPWKLGLSFPWKLGLSFPWKVMSSDFDAQAGRLDIRIDFPRGSRFCCPTCGTSGPAYDTREMTWRHLLSA